MRPCTHALSQGTWLSNSGQARRTPGRSRHRFNSSTVNMSSGRGRRRGRARGRGRVEGQDTAETDTSRPSVEISTQTETQARSNTSDGDQPVFTEEQQSWLSQFIENQVASCKPQRERPTVCPNSNHACL